MEDPANQYDYTEILNGTTIHFQIHGRGEPLLLLHGFGGCGQDWIDAALKHSGNATQKDPSSVLQKEWREQFQIILPDMRGHGRSFPIAPRRDAGASDDEPRLFRHDDAAKDILALLDRLNIQTFKAAGISGGGNVMLHIATKQPARVLAMVLVSATSYFPAQARAIMREYAAKPPATDMEVMRKRHPGGDGQIAAILASTSSFADSYDDLTFTPPHFATITARTLIVQGDRDPLYPVEISVEMARAIPHSSLWIIPDAGHGPVIGNRWPEFVKTSVEFLNQGIAGPR